MSDVILDVKNLKQFFKVDGGKVVKAVDDISFTINKGETFGLVGESGSGKSTTGRSIIRLYDPTSGEVYYKDKLISSKLTKEEKKELARSMQMIFQDPYASLNPRMTVEFIIREGLDIHFPNLSVEEKKEKVAKLLETVGLSRYHMTRYPHEFSGGQLQRIGIARSLAVKPELIIADEPISALDISIQAQVVNLLKKLQKDFGLTYLFIAHDLAMVRYISDKIGVMHLGHIVELGDAEKIYSNPIHPYTKSLLSAAPVADPLTERDRVRKRYSVLEYDVENSQLREIEENHFVYCTEDEFLEFKSQLAKSN